mgnify:FL=1|jgi:hypothetical protein
MRSCKVSLRQERGENELNSEVFQFALYIFSFALILYGLIGRRFKAKREKWGMIIILIILILFGITKFVFM